MEQDALLEWFLQPAKRGRPKTRTPEERKKYLAEYHKLHRERRNIMQKNYIRAKKGLPLLEVPPIERPGIPRELYKNLTT